MPIKAKGQHPHIKDQKLMPAYCHIYQYREAENYDWVTARPPLGASVKDLHSVIALPAQRLKI